MVNLRGKKLQFPTLKEKKIEIGRVCYKPRPWLILNKIKKMVLKLGHFGQQIRNTWKVLKCGAGEG